MAHSGRHPYIYPMTRYPPLTVYYDGDCPLCRIEVRFYAKLDRANAITWIDIMDTDEAALPNGKTRQELLGKFHVKDSEADGGAWHVGVDAFARIWRSLPGFAHVAWLFSVPGLRQLSMLAYRAFLRWQRWHRTHRRPS